jgi:hypothetical protein
MLNTTLYQTPSFPGGKAASEISNRERPEEHGGQIAAASVIFVSFRVFRGQPHQITPKKKARSGERALSV